MRLRGEKRHRKNECDALTVHESQNGEFRMAGGHLEIFLQARGVRSQPVP